MTLLRIASVVFVLFGVGCGAPQNGRSSCPAAMGSGKDPQRMTRNCPPGDRPVCSYDLRGCETCFCTSAERR